MSNKRLSEGMREGLNSKTGRGFMDTFFRLEEEVQKRKLRRACEEYAKGSEGKQAEELIEEIESAMNSVIEEER